MHEKSIRPTWIPTLQKKSGLITNIRQDFQANAVSIFTISAGTKRLKADKKTVNFF